MSGFENVIGHEDIIEHFQNAIKLDKISHAYIINGENGSGKKLLADIFSTALQCEQHGINPCGSCQSCKQAVNRNQPDIKWISHEKPTSIGVEDIRSQLIGDMQIKPYHSPYKIYIIDEAEKLTIQAQNALLKTIESPPSYGIVILLTSNSDSLLATILSRCIVLNTKPILDNKICAYLMEQLQIPDYKANICVAFAQGNLGKAIRLAGSEDFDEMKRNMTRLLQRIHSVDTSILLDFIKEIETYKDSIMDYLDLMLVWFRDVLLFKVTNDVNILIFREDFSSISKQAAHCSYEGLEEIIAAIDKAKIRLRANVSFELVIELLLLTIKEN